MKDIIIALHYTLNINPPGDADPTWVEIPFRSLLSDNASPFAEEPQFAGLLNGAQRIAAVDGSASYPVVVEAGETFLAALETALNDGDPVWIRETLAGGHTIVVGGESGCTGGVSLGRGGRGGFVMKLVQVYAPGAESGDGYAITAAS